MSFALNNLARWVVPYNAWLMLKDWKTSKVRKHHAASLAPVDPSVFDYAGAIEYLGAQGCDIMQVREGSMPEESLRYLASFLDASAGRPLNGVHVGNFVGVSFAYFASAIQAIHPDSILVGIDPNIPHRGVQNPQSKTMSLLNHFGLQRNAAILTGYTLEKNAMDDGKDYQTPHAEYKMSDFSAAEGSCEMQLSLLDRLCPRLFDFALIDGNHDGEYLSREIGMMDGLLKNKGLLFLDDVSLAWHEIERVFEKVDGAAYTKLGRDGRVGVLRKN